jgi:hypothetical protein
MNGVFNAWTRETHESSEEQLQQAQELDLLLTDSQHTPEQPAPDAEPTSQAADQPAKRVPWWWRLFADI